MNIVHPCAMSLIFSLFTGEVARLASQHLYEESVFCHEFASQRIPGFATATPVTCRDGECVGIRWTDNTRLRAVANRVPNNAREWYPVSCSEAKYEVSKSRHTTGVYLNRRPIHEQAYVGPETTNQLLRVPMNGRGDQDLKVTVKDAGTQTGTQRDVGTQTDADSTRSQTVADSTRPVSRSTTDETRVDLHYHRKVEDSRPRIHVRLVKQADNNPEPFDLLLDTGSHVSYIRTRSLKCPAGAGYQDGGAAKPAQTALRFGEVNRPKHVLIGKQVNETALIGSGFSFPLHLNVATTCEDKYIGTGLLGAGRGSHLAKAAGVFAFMPSGRKYEFAHNTRSAGTLLIGRRDWNQYCQSKIHKFSNNYKLSPVHWIVSGSITLSTPYMTYKSPPVNWVVDTGAAQMLLTPSLYMQLVSSIWLAGGRMPDRSPSKMNIIHNCVQSMAFFPPFRVSLGTGPSKFVLDIPPTDYLGYVDEPSGNCYLKIEYSEIAGLPNTGIIGMIFLENVFTIFDRRSNRLGFCKPRN